MSHFYAQINAARVAYAVTAPAGPIQAPDMVPLDTFDESVIGKRHNAETGEWEALPPPPEPPRYLTKLGFRNRFTSAEKVAIEIACLDDPSAPMAQRQQAAMLRASQADQRDATFINPKLPETRNGVVMLESAGILAAGRALQILDAYVEDHELFRG